MSSSLSSWSWVLVAGMEVMALLAFAGLEGGSFARAWL